MIRKASQRKRPQHVSSQTLARRAVDEYFDLLLASPDALVEGFACQAGIDFQAVDVVQDAVKAEFIADGLKPANDDDGFDEMCARAAGYLIGLQVGLRLRTVP